MLSDKIIKMKKVQSAIIILTILMISKTSFGATNKLEKSE